MSLGCTKSSHLLRARDTPLHLLGTRKKSMRQDIGCAVLWACWRSFTDYRTHCKQGLMENPVSLPYPSLQLWGTSKREEVRSCQFPPNGWALFRLLGEYLLGPCSSCESGLTVGVQGVEVDCSPWLRCLPEGQLKVPL